MLIVFGALKIELENIIRSCRIKKKVLSGRTRLSSGTYKGKDILIAVTGMGKNNAQRAAGIVFGREKVRSAGSIDVLITGFCGGTSPDLEAGKLVSYREVLDLSGVYRTGIENKKLHSSHCGSISLPAGVKIRDAKAVVCGCTHHVVSTPREKKRLFDEYGADVVDMESYWLIQSIKEHGLPLENIKCIRAVSDDFSGMLPHYFSAGNTFKTIAGFIRSSFLSIFFRKERWKNLYALKGIRKAKSRLNINLLDSM
jgi:nucleoside phosphorylase